MTEIANSELLLNRFYANVDARGDDVYLVQPTGGGEVTEYTFKAVHEQAARMATHLASLGFEPRSKIAIVAKNSAHFFMAELAIWMAGHVTVALYPTLSADAVRYILEHSDAKFAFLGKLDAGPWAEIQKGLVPGMPVIAFPLAPKTDFRKWDDVVATSAPIEGRPARSFDDPALIIYTSGSTGQPKGAVHTFRSLTVPTIGLAKLLNITKDDRSLSYLPLAHSMDRWLSEMLSLYTGYRVYFAESLDTFVVDLKRARPTVFVSVPRLWLKFQLGVFQTMPRRRLEFLLKIPFISGRVKRRILENLGLDQVRFAEPDPANRT